MVFTAGEGSSKERDRKVVLGGIPENWSMFPRSTGSSFNIQPYSSPMLPSATNGGGGHQHSAFQGPRFGPLGRSALGSSTWAPPPAPPATPQLNLPNALPFSPFTNFQHYSLAWEVTDYSFIIPHKTNIYNFIFLSCSNQFLHYSCYQW